MSNTDISESRDNASGNAAAGVRAESKTRDESFIMDGHHCHGCCELFYVEDGECRFLIDDNIYDLRRGDFIFVPPLVLHYTRYLFGTCKRTVMLFGEEDVSGEIRVRMPERGGFFSGTRFFSVPMERKDDIDACVASLAAEDGINDQMSVEIRRLRLNLLLAMCCRHCDFRGESPTDIHTDDIQIYRAARFIRENYMEPLTTADVAKAVGFSPNYLSRKFRESAGIGLHEYLVFIRLYHASQALVSSDSSITEIAFRCGFSDSNYFKDAFKKKYGVSPREYRKLT